MTMADATRFADNALEHMVRTLGAALAAPQILESTQGALRWDGLQYERRYRRLLSPPLQRLLTQPGAIPHCPQHTFPYTQLSPGDGKYVAGICKMANRLREVCSLEGVFPPGYGCHSVECQMKHTGEE